MELHFVDCPGTPALKSVIPDIVAECQAAFYVCDLTRPETATGLQEWQRVFSDATLHTDFPVLVVGMKTDANVSSSAQRIASDFAARLGTWLVTLSTVKPDREAWASVSMWAERLYQTTSHAAIDEIDLAQ